jgi:hypothetical protein
MIKYIYGILYGVFKPVQEFDDFEIIETPMSLTSPTEPLAGSAGRSCPVPGPIAGPIRPIEVVPDPDIEIPCDKQVRRNKYTNKNKNIKKNKHRHRKR